MWVGLRVERKVQLTVAEKVAELAVLLAVCSVVVTGRKLVD